MKYRVKSSIVLKSQIGSQLWKTWTRRWILRNRAWETIRQNIKTSAKESLGYYEFKKHKPWFDEGCYKLLDQINKPNCSG
jgi:hypothetical protein